MMPPRRILIVDDDRTTARDLAARLTRMAFVVTGVTASGEEAIVLAERDRSELVVVDLHLAGTLDGIAAADRIRAHLRIPVVFLAAHADEEMLRAARVTEASGYILTPAQDRELRIVIEAALYKHAAEHQRQELEQRLQRSDKLDSIGRLAGGIAHDFNNVLLAIQSHCRSLIGELPAGQRPKPQVALIQAAAERGARMVRQLLAVDRDDLEQPSAIDLAAHIHDTTAMLARLICDDIAVVTSVARDLRPVLGRSAQIEQVVMNLVINARDAMPSGGTLTVAAHNVPGGDTVLLTVADTGEGMDRATRERVFEPFFTTKAAGSGLGLATVHAIIARSHGKIDVTSELGKGTTFSIWLPAAPAEPRDAIAVPSSPIEGTLVLVEDDEQVRPAIRAILEQAGLRVIEARDGFEALRACRAHPGQIDLVLSDLGLPRLGGAELARTLALDVPTAKIIYMSGHPSRSLLGGSSQDIGPVLQKPFTPEELLDSIRDALRSKAA